MTKKSILKQMKASIKAIPGSDSEVTTMRRWRKGHGPCRWCSLEWPNRDFPFLFLIPGKRSLKKLKFCSAFCIFNFSKKFYENYAYPHPVKRGKELY